MLSNHEIGLRISSAREMRGLTLDDIATEVGVARSTIQRYEKGTISKIKLPVLQSIASALNVNPNWLIGNTDDPDAGKGPRQISDEDIKAAFWGGEQDLSPEEIDALWAETKDYIAFRTAQRKKKKK